MEVNDDMIEIPEAHVESTSADSSTEPSQPKSSQKKGSPILVIIIIIIILAAIGGGAFYLLKDPSIDEEPVTTVGNNTLTVPSVAPTSVPTTTPTPEPIDRSEITINVLNGTGIPQEASYLQEIFEDLGYEEIDVGNADEQDQEQTTVTFSEGLSKTAVDEITDTLEGEYKDVRVKTSDLDEYDIEVITGLRKGQTLPTDTPANDSSDDEDVDNADEVETSEESSNPAI